MHGALVQATHGGHATFARTTAKMHAYHRTQWSALSRTEVEHLHDLLARALWASDAP